MAGQMRRTLVAVVAGLTLVLAGVATTGTASANVGADLDQCANGPAGAHTDCTNANGGWVNGNLNQSKAHYREGDSVPFRLVITGLTNGTDHSVVIEYDSVRGGKHAYDYLTSYNRTEVGADPCTGTGASCAQRSDAPIPADPLLAPAGVTPAPQNERMATIFGGTGLTAGPITVSGGNADRSSSIEFRFTATGNTAVLAWGGHIATATDWGTGNSASGVSGSPYHMRLLSLDAAGGNQDRSISADAVDPADYSCQPATNVTTTSADLNASTSNTSVAQATFTLYQGNAQVGNPQDDTTPNNGAFSVHVAGLTPGTTYNYKVEFKNSVGTILGTSSGCSLTTSSPAPTYQCAAPSNISHNSATLNGTTSDGAVNSATFSLTGPAGTTTHAGTGGGGAWSAAVTGLTPSTAYSYTVTFNPGGHAQTNAACTFTTSAAPPAPASIQIVKDAVPDSPQDFAFTTTGNGLSNFLLDDDADPTLPNSQTFSNLGAGTYTVTETATAGWSLTNLTCTGGTTQTDQPNRRVTITLAAGDNVSCRFENTQQNGGGGGGGGGAPQTFGSLTVAKSTSNGDGAFTFAVDCDGTSFDRTVTVTTANGSGSSAAINNIPDGTRCTVTEQVPQGWTATTATVQTVTISGPTTVRFSNSKDAAPKPAVDLALVKTDDKDPATLGDPITYTITVTNRSLAPATGVVVSDRLPTGVTFVSASSGCSASGSVVTCSTAGIAPGQSATFTIVVRGDTVGVLRNTATVAGTESDPDLSNNTDSEDTEVVQVLGELLTQEAPPAAAPAPEQPRVLGAPLPRTGIEVVRSALVGTGLLLLGVGFVLGARPSRRRFS